MLMCKKERNNAMKRFTALFLSILMLFGTASTSVFAAASDSNDNGMDDVFDEWQAVVTPTPDDTVRLARNAVLYAAKSIDTYIKNNPGTLPNYSSIDEEKIYMPEMLGLLAQLIVDMNYNNARNVARNFAAETDTVYEQMSAGTLIVSEYVELAQKTVDYIAQNDMAPGCLESSLGTLSFYTLMRVFAAVCTSFRSMGVLCSTVSVAAWENPLPIPPEEHAEEFELNNVLNAARSINTYNTNNEGKFPNYVSIGEEKVYMFEALGLFAQMIVNLSGNDAGVVTRNDATFFETAYENVTGTTLTKAQYVEAAQAVVTHVNSSPTSSAPGFINTAAGDLSHQTLLKLFASIGAQYRETKVLPETVTVSAWTDILPTPPVPTEPPEYTYLTFKYILSGAVRVQTNIETNNAMPNYVTVEDSRMYQGTMLRMFASTVANISRGKAVDMPFMEVATPSRLAAETITSCSLTKAEYVSLANRIAETIYKNSALPNYCTTTQGTMNHYSMIYMYARILNFYHQYNFLPDTIEVAPWSY